MGHTYHEFCPVAAVLVYLVRQSVDQGPLFMLASGQPFTRQKLVDMVKQSIKQAGIDPSNYSCHSFHTGAATMATANGIGDTDVWWMVK